MVQIFEVGDIAILDDNDVGAKNLRQLAALYCGANAGFEVYSVMTWCNLFGFVLVEYISVSTWLDHYTQIYQWW